MASTCASPPPSPGVLGLPAAACGASTWKSWSLIAPPPQPPHPTPRLQAFQAYRLLVLPVANTWMSWSLLNKLGITPGLAVVAAIGCVVLACLVLGVQVGEGGGGWACGLAWRTRMWQLFLVGGTLPSWPLPFPHGAVHGLRISPMDAEHFMCSMHGTGPLAAAAAIGRC